MEDSACELVTVFFRQSRRGRLLKLDRLDRHRIVSQTRCNRIRSFRPWFAVFVTRRAPAVFGWVVLCCFLLRDPSQSARTGRSVSAWGGETSLSCPPLFSYIDDHYGGLLEVWTLVANPRPHDLTSSLFRCEVLVGGWRAALAYSFMLLRWRHTVGRRHRVNTTSLCYIIRLFLIVYRYRLVLLRVMWLVTALPWFIVPRGNPSHFDDLLVFSFGAVIRSKL